MILLPVEANQRSKNVSNKKVVADPSAAGCDAISDQVMNQKGIRHGTPLGRSNLIVNRLGPAMH